MQCLQRGRFHKTSQGTLAPATQKKSFPHAEVELLVVLFMATTGGVASHTAGKAQHHQAQSLPPPLCGGCGDRASGGRAGPGGRRGCPEHQSALGTAREGGRKRRGGTGDAANGESGRACERGTWEQEPLTVRKGGASQSETAVETGEPMASRAGGLPANQGASSEQKGLSKAPAPFLSTISHDATAAGSGSRAVPAAAIL